MKTFSIRTLGCKVNQYESDKIRSIMTGAGFIEVAFKEEADIRIINTCSVTKVADAKARQLINKAAGLKGLTYVTGCSVENPESNIDQKNISVIANNKKIEFFQKLCHKTPNSQSPPFSLSRESEKGFYKNLFFRSRPLVRIQNGCTQECSYCIVPSLRGKVSVSRDANEVLEEVKNISDAGFGEIVLTGINIGLYNYNGIILSDLVEKIIKIKNNFRVRISSIELNAINSSLIKNISNSKIADHLHIPLQSGSDKILKMMNRPYKTDDFYRKVSLIREKNPDMAITTDCIVGFPGESNDDFNETIKAVNKIKFAKVHIFRYSSRPMTKAALFKENVSETDKKKRFNELKEITEKHRERYLRSQMGKEVKVLCEKFDNDYLFGVSGNYIKVKFKAGDGLLKKLVSVKIKKIADSYCVGEKG